MKPFSPCIQIRLHNIHVVKCFEYIQHIYKCGFFFIISRMSAPLFADSAEKKKDLETFYYLVMVIIPVAQK